MAFTFAEGLVDELITYLNTNLPAKLDSIDSQLDDGITLEDVAEYLRRDPSNPRAITKLPACFVIVPRTTLVNWRETSAQENHIVWIYLVVRNNDVETLRKLLYRYARATWETLVDHYFDTATWKMGVGLAPTFDFGETLTSGSMAMADVKLELAFEKLETE